MSTSKSVKIGIKSMDCIKVKKKNCFEPSRGLIISTGLPLSIFLHLLSSDKTLLIPHLPVPAYKSKFLSSSPQISLEPLHLYKVFSGWPQPTVYSIRLMCCFCTMLTCADLSTVCVCVCVSMHIIDIQLHCGLCGRGTLPSHVISFFFLNKVFFKVYFIYLFFGGGR